MADLGNIAQTFGAGAAIPTVVGDYTGDGGTISGNVNVAGAASRARVYLIRTGCVVAVSTAGDDGAFEFRNLAAGSYEVLVYGEGVHRSRVFGPIEIP